MVLMELMARDTQDLVVINFTVNVHIFNSTSQSMTD